VNRKKDKEDKGQSGLTQDNAPEKALHAWRNLLSSNGFASP
jgi:hypothetical protein